MARIGIWTLKLGAVWAALVVGSIIGGMLGVMMFAEIASPPARPPDGGPLAAEAAPFVIAFLHAGLIAALAAQARVRGAWLGLFLFVIFFGAQTFMMQIETVYFNESLRVPLDSLVVGVTASAIAAAFGSATAALAFRPEPMDAPSTPGLGWRIPVVAGAYLCFYFAAGLVFVYQNEAARAFYDQFDHFSVAWLPALQFGRGLLWALMALLIVRNLKGSLATRAVMTGLAFSVFGAAQLLYPNPYMPWPVRFAHLIEIGVSNALFGALAAVLLGARGSLARQANSRSASPSR